MVSDQQLVPPALQRAAAETVRSVRSLPPPLLTSISTLLPPSLSSDGLEEISWSWRGELVRLLKQQQQTFSAAALLFTEDMGIKKVSGIIPRLVWILMCLRGTTGEGKVAASFLIFPGEDDKCCQMKRESIKFYCQRLDSRKCTCHVQKTWTSHVNLVCSVMRKSG